MERLELAERVWLFLDYDGTLAEFAPTPDHILVDQELVALLSNLAKHPVIRVAIISGRRLPQIKRLVPVQGILLAGSYGVELLTSEGEQMDRLDFTRLRPLLDRLKPEIEAQIRDKKGYFLEDKGWALALHARYADRNNAAEVMPAVKRLMGKSADHGVFRIQGGNEFLEIAPQSADKGQTVEYLLEKQPWPGALLIYFGDDERDEEAYKVIQERGGIACRVGHNGEATAADCALSSPQEVREWLRALLDRLDASTYRMKLEGKEMNKEDLEDIRQDLLDRRDTFCKRIEEENKKIDRNESDNPDPTDLSQDYNLRQRISGIVDRYEQEIIEIDSALNRIDEGSYGICENCGNPIPQERLHTMPQARLCVRCQSEHQLV